MYSQPIRLLIPLVAAQLGLATGSLHAQGTPEEEFLRLEQEWTNALARRDSVVLDRLLSPEFTIIGAASTADYAVTDRAFYLRNAMRFQCPHREVLVLDVQLFGNVAVVRCVWRGTDPPPSSVIPILAPRGGTFEFLITDVWVRGDRDGRFSRATHPFPYQACISPIEVACVRHRRYIDMWNADPTALSVMRRPSADDERSARNKLISRTVHVGVKLSRMCSCDRRRSVHATRLPSNLLEPPPAIASN